ncbi:Hypothetical protein, putative [Bodo saltans]|uniref:C2 domain-containing protein n=1 Tax=Bodo saltans TaxID=75058 RepID=A0A0S4IY35_BODSA|nr:Hypothetical protein, putative [Bodo saltans]|eukprot:CUF99007.1 Hypothetical protein, putative [Bodo saltans]
MSDHWRRATAIPSTTGAGSPYASQMNVVVPPGLNASQLRNPYLDTSPHHPYASPPAHPNQSRESVMYEYDEARRTYLGILQRERAELDNAKHEVDALSYEKASLRKNLGDAELRAAAAARERDIANAKVIADTASLRAQVSQSNGEAASLKDELNRVQHAYTSTLLERSQYEALVASLRAEVMAAGRTIVEQTGTIRALTHEMSRRDPYHLIKERREQGHEPPTAAGGAELGKLHSTIAGLEDQVKRLQAEKAVLEAKAREDAGVASRLLETKVAGAADAFRANETALRAQVKALESDLIKVRQAAIEAAEEADKKDLELRASKIKGESDRQLAADLGRQLAELKKGGAIVSSPIMKATNPQQLDEERNRYESKIADGLNTIRDASQQVRAANTVITQLESGTLPADIKDAVLIDVGLTVVSGEKLLDRDPKNKGLLDPFVRIFDIIGDKILETDPCVDTSAPKFVAAKSSGKTRVARSGKGSLRLEVWARVGPNDPEQFMGMAFVSTASLIEGGNTQRTVSLQPRADEPDQVIVQNAKSLGTITIAVTVGVAGAKAAAPRGAPAAPASAPPAAAAAVVSAAPAAKPAVAAQPPVAAQATAPIATPMQPVAPPVAPKPPVVEAPKPIAREQPKTDVAQNVLLQIVGCDRVIHRDTLNSKSDPYVLIFRAGAKEPIFKSSVKSSTDAPRWLPDATGSITVPVSRLQPEPFIFQVWDDDIGDDEFLGEAKMTIDDILAGSGPRTFDLCPRDNEPDKTIAQLRGQLGTITVSVLIVSAASTQDKPPTTSVAPDGTTAKPSVAEIKAVSTGPAQKMLIYVAKCSNLLKNPGMFANTDPYVEIAGPQGETKATPIVNKTENPTWKVGEASMQAIIAPSDESFYTFTVLDDDKTLGVGSIRFCGMLQLTCNEMLALGEGTHTLPLKPRKNESEAEIKKNADKLGTITIQLSRIYAQPGGSTPAGVVAPGVTASGAGAPATAAAAAAAAQLPTQVDDFREVIFTVLEAKDVLARNMFKGSDIFVTVSGVDGQVKHRTLVRDNTTHATWSEAEGRVTMLLSPSTQRDQSITLDVYDKETVGADHYLGFLKIPVPLLFQLNGQTRTEKLTPNPSKKDSKVDESKDKLGTVTYKVSISGVTTDVMSSMMVGDIANRRAAPSTTTPFSVRIWVKGCNKLRNRQVNGEISDPYVVIKDTQGREHSAPTKANTLDPTWTVVEGSMISTINPQEASGVIYIDVRDIGCQSGLKPLGSARILVKDLVKEGFGERTLLLGAGPKENDPFILQNDGQLGTVTVSVVPDDGSAAAPAPPAAAASGGSANVLAPFAASTSAVPCTVRLLSGEQLLKRKATSSPCVEAYDSSNQLLFTAPTIASNLNPVWSGQPNTSKVVSLSPLDAGELLFKIFDDNAAGRGAMGVARVPVKSLFTGTSTRFTIAVTPSATESDAMVLGGKGALGSLQIEVVPVSAAASAAPAGASSAAAPAPGVKPAPPVAAAASPVVAAPAAAQPNAPRRIPILVKVKSAKDLRKGDTFNSDPLVRIFKNDEQVFQSETIDSNLNPVWDNAKATVNITVPSNDKLTFQVLDQDKNPFTGISYDDLGSAILSAADVMSKLGVDQELPLIIKGEAKGKLIVNFSQE